MANECHADTKSLLLPSLEETKALISSNVDLYFVISLMLLDEQIEMEMHMCFLPVHVLNTSVAIIKVAPENTADMKGMLWAFCACGIYSKQMRRKCWRFLRAVNVGWDPICKLIVLIL